MVGAMTKASRAEKAAALERWADDVQSEELVEVDTTVLRQIAELADKRETLEGELTRAVIAARRSNRS